MAMAANPPLSPQPVAVSSAAENGAVSPQTRRRNLSSPWAHVVRGIDSESTAAAGSVSSSPPPPPQPPSVVSESPERASFPRPSGQNFPPENLPDNSCNNDDNADRSKKPAWKKPLNGVVEPGSVMGGSVSWPALSESTRSTIKTSSDSSKPLSEGSPSSSQGPIISQTPQRQVNTNQNHGMHRQRSMRHRGGGSGPVGGSVQGVYNRSPPAPPFPPFPMMEMPHYMNYGNFMPPQALDSCARGPRSMGVAGMQAGNDHSPSQRNSSRRNNFGSRPRGDGQYYHGSRRDSDRRDVPVSFQYIPRGCIPPPPPPPPPPGSAPFVPPHMRHMVSPMAFDMASPQFVYVPTLPPEQFRGVPVLHQVPRPPIYYPVADLPLAALIVKQIDYYFSDANLVKDDFLRSNMDGEGWVSISLIANFRRVHQLTTDIPLILDSLRGSMVVEVQGDKIRRRNDWQRWTHSSSRMLNESISQTPTMSPEDSLQTSMERLLLNDDNSSNSQVEEVALLNESPNLLKGELAAEEARSSQT